MMSKIFESAKLEEIMQHPFICDLGISQKC